LLQEQILFFGLPIQLDENTAIYQPTLNDIIENNLSVEKILEPFIALDKRRFEQEVENNKISNFDMLFVQIILGYIQYLAEVKENIGLTEWINSKESNWLTIKKLIEILKFLMKTDDISLHISDISKDLIGNLEGNHIIINKSYKIDRDTFDDLKYLICEMLDTEINIDDMSIKETVKKTDEELRLEKLFEQKKREYEKKYGKKKEKKVKNKDNITIFTLINYIIHYEYTQYNYTSVRNLTIYQIKNTFKYYHGQEMYDIDMKYRTSGNFKMDKKSADHWFFDK
jgi:hypothetical protein